MQRKHTNFDADKTIVLDRTTKNNQTKFEAKVLFTMGRSL